LQWLLKGEIYIRTKNNLIGIQLFMFRYKKKWRAGFGEAEKVRIFALRKRGMRGVV